ncbi:MAG: hypothetical protein IJ648_03325 [Lachnospiraceae bacterium]|nr:hypothetical protein [Lachnospiraceae bacterium]
MKKSMMIITLIAGTAMLSACGSNVTTELSEQTDQIASEASSEADRLQEEASEAADTAADKVSEAYDKANEAADQASEAAEQAMNEADQLLKEFQESAVEDVDLSGSWQDEISQRASMDVTKNDDGSYDILVHWGGSAFETAIWEIHGTYDGAAGELLYNDGKYSIHTFDEDGTETISSEETTNGGFIMEDGKLRWKDSMNDSEGLFTKMQ